MDDKHEQNAPESSKTSGSDVVQKPVRTPQQPTIQLDIAKMKQVAEAAGLKSNQPRIFGDYELLEGIAQGGMGAIYKARQMKLNRTVALKTILAGPLAGEDQMKRFRAEAEAVANLDHPNIVPIYEVGDYEGQLFFSMRYVEGGSLDDHMARYNHDPHGCAVLMAKVARAIHFAHQHGILHRDMKPDNILLDAQGEPHVTDFGLAKRVDAGENITVTGEIIGTPNYMSPEQAEGKGVQLTTAVDVYGLGAVLYQLLTGKPPFRADSPLETLRLVIDREPDRPSSVNRRIDRDLETICLKCMEKDPQRRYGSAEAVAEDLERWLRKEPILARPSGYIYRARKWAARRPAVALLAVTTLTGLATLLGVILVNEQRLQKERDFALDQEKFATEQRKKAEALAEQSRQRLVRLNVGDGQRFLDEGDSSAALLSFVDALKLDEGRPQSEEIQRTRIASTLRQTPRLIQFWTEDAQIITSAASSNSRFLATFTKQRVRLWDVTSGESIGKTVNLPHSVKTAALSPNGQQLVLMNDDRTAYLWNWRTDKKDPIKLEHDLPVNYASFSSDGNYVATAGGQLRGNGLVRVWDTKTGEAVGSPITLGGEADHVTFSPDGTRIAIASKDKTASVWDTMTGKRIAGPMQHRDVVRHVSFSPDGRKVVTSSADLTARIWDATKGEPLTPPMQHNGAVTYAEFSPDGLRVVTANKDNTGRVWDAQTGEPLTPPLAHSSRVARARFSPDGRRVLTVAEKSARVWNAFTGQPLTPPLPHSAEILHALFNPDGRSVMIVSKDRTVRVWDTPPAQQNSRELPLKGELKQTILSKDNRQMLAVAEKTLRVWDVMSGDAVSPIITTESEILAARFLPDQRINTIGKDQYVRVWDGKSGREMFQMKIPEAISFATFSPDGSVLLTADYDHKAYLTKPDQNPRARVLGAKRDEFQKKMEAAGFKKQDPNAKKDDPNFKKDNQLPRRAPPDSKTIQHKGRIAYAQFNADSTRVVTASWDNTARVWNTETGEAITPPLEHTDRVVLASFSPDGSKVVTASWDNTARIWDAKTGKPLSPPLQHTAELTLASFSPDGRFVVTASTDNTARVWNASTGDPVTPYLQHNGWVVAAAFSPDGTRVVTASWDNTARIWDTFTGAPITPPLLHRDRVDHASFTQDGRTLFTASADGTTRLWDVTPDNRPVEEITMLAQLLSGRRIDSTGSLVAVTSANLVEFWNKLHTKYPQQFSIKKDEIVAWHTEEADICEQSSAWYAAVFHLNWLVERDPNNAELLKRKNEAVAKLKEITAAREN